MNFSSSYKASRAQWPISIFYSSIISFSTYAISYFNSVSAPKLAKSTKSVLANSTNSYKSNLPSWLLSKFYKQAFAFPSISSLVTF